MNMQYFVSIENTSYFYWQVELLIESFKRRKLEDKLVIAIAENNDPKWLQYSKNIIAHQNKFIHHNVGAEKGYKPLNRIFSIVTALNAGILKEPFALIHADMILKNPLKEPQHNVTIQHPEAKSFPEIEKYVEEVAAIKQVSRKELPEFLCIDGTVIFKEMPELFYKRVWQREEELLAEHGPEWPCEKAAWSLALYDVMGFVTVRFDYLDGVLLEHQVEPNFIHYKHGLPPVFHKKYYKLDKEFSLNADDPFDCLLAHNPTSLSDFLQKIVLECRK